MQGNITSDEGTWIELSDTDEIKVNSKPISLTWGISYNDELVLKRRVVKILSKKKCLKKYNQYVICVLSNVSFGRVRNYEFILNTNVILYILNLGNVKVLNFCLF